MSASELQKFAALGSAKKLLTGIFASDPGVHAILLYGQEGSGKSTLARMLAQFWLCTGPGANGPCGSCQACTSFGKGTCADILMIEPAGPSAWIRLAAIREDKDKKEDDPPYPLQMFFRTPPLAARHKVAIIESADRLNNDAGSALLKTLEEPETHAKLILTTNAVGRLLPTVVSRCLCVACECPTGLEWRSLIDFEPIEGMNVGKALAEPWRLEFHKKLESIARKIAESPQGDALSLADELRASADFCANSSGMAARLASAETLGCLGNLLPVGLGHHSRTLVAEAHRRVMGNINSSLVFDSLLAALMARKTHFGT